VSYALAVCSHAESRPTKLPRRVRAAARRRSRPRSSTALRQASGPRRAETRLRSPRVRSTFVRRRGRRLAGHVRAGGGHGMTARAHTARAIGSAGTRTPTLPVPPLTSRASRRAAGINIVSGPARNARRGGRRSPKPAEAIGDLCGVCGDERKRLPGGSALHGKDPGHGSGIERIRRQAIQRIRRIATMLPGGSTWPPRRSHRAEANPGSTNTRRIDQSTISFCTAAASAAITIRSTRNTTRMELPRETRR